MLTVCNMSKETSFNVYVGQLPEKKFPTDKVDIEKLKLSDKNTFQEAR